MGKKYLDVKKGSLESSILGVWQDAAESVDIKEEKTIKESYEVGTEKYLKYLEKLTPGETFDEEKGKGDKAEYQKFFKSAMKKFGVTSPNQLKGPKRKEFYDYVDKNWTADHESVEEMFQLAKEFKVSSMKEAMAKVWSFNEGELPPALKKAIDDKKKDKEKKDEEIKGNKTLTGKKAAAVEIDPKPELGEKKHMKKSFTSFR